VDDGVMNIVFRVDSSTRIGSGHVMRCLTLAESLRHHGGSVSFICRELAGNICNVVEARGFAVHRLADSADASAIAGEADDYAKWLGVDQAVDAQECAAILRGHHGGLDWLVADHYALDSCWETILREYTGGILVIDDLANRPHDCDILLDQNLHYNATERYRGLVPDGCHLLCGPEFALLRKEFLDAGRRVKRRSQTAKRLLVFFGGVDRTNETSRACRAILSLNRPDLEADVVVGPANRHGEIIRDICRQSPQFRFHQHVDNMAELMLDADLAIGAGGTTAWERAYLGLPTIAVTIARNQVPGTEVLAQKRAVYYVGHWDKVTVSQIADAIRLALDRPTLREEMSRSSCGLFGADPVPGVERVIQAMEDSVHAVADRL
jgi:UDP-2,4-diacetamido-2,4,6-trideoxy-beta-L-altropyranose hydrolase